MQKIKEVTTDRSGTRNSEATSQNTENKGTYQKIKELTTQKQCNLPSQTLWSSVFYHHKPSEAVHHQLETVQFTITNLK